MGDDTKGKRAPDAGATRGAEEDPPILGRPPRAHESERPASGRSVSQPPPGATGEHANPVAPGEPTPRTVKLPPGAAVLPRRAADMSATGARLGPHGQAPDAPERRVTQQDWERWRAADRRQAPFEYPSWRS